MAEVKLEHIRKIYPLAERIKRRKQGIPEKKNNLQITDEGIVAVASEVCALNQLLPDRDPERDIYPGERDLVEIGNDLEVRIWKQ